MSGNFLLNVVAVVVVVVVVAVLDVVGFYVLIDVLRIQLQKKVVVLKREGNKQYIIWLGEPDI